MQGFARAEPLRALFGDLLAHRPESESSVQARSDGAVIVSQGRQKHSEGDKGTGGSGVRHRPCFSCVAIYSPA